MGEIPLMTETVLSLSMEPKGLSSLSCIGSLLFFSITIGGRHIPLGKLLFSARIIPYRGSWLDFEFDPKDHVYVRIDRRRKLPATVLLRALGWIINKYYPLFLNKINLFVDKDEVKFSLVPERLRGETLDFDLLDKDGNILVEAGRRVTARHTKEIEKKECQKSVFLVLFS